MLPCKKHKHQRMDLKTRCHKNLLRVEKVHSLLLRWIRMILGSIQKRNPLLNHKLRRDPTKKIHQLCYLLFSTKIYSISHRFPKDLRAKILSLHLKFLLAKNLKCQKMGSFYLILREMYRLWNKYSLQILIWTKLGKVKRRDSFVKRVNLVKVLNFLTLKVWIQIEI